MPVCPSCGREGTEGFAFCPACGSPLPAISAHELRKTVTVVFCDLTGSTSLGERLDPETLRTVMTRYFEEMRIALERHGGTVEKFIGDAVMAVFGSPVVHEDDALRAVRAASAMRTAIDRLNEQLERNLGVAIMTRIGVNTGAVVAGDPATGQALVTGDAVNVAARLEQAAPPGGILLGADTYRLVRAAVRAEPVEPLELKGKSEPVAAYLLAEVVDGARVHERRLRSAMVGRDGPLRMLTEAFRGVAETGGCRLVTVLGPPGVGKTRLVEEFEGVVDGGGRVLRGQCAPYGEGVGYAPALEAIKQAAGLPDFGAPAEVRDRLLAVVGEDEHAELLCSRVSQLLGLAGAEAAPEETLWAIRRFCEAAARNLPLVVVFEDVHWADPVLLDLIEHVAEWSRGSPILLLCTARPDLLDDRPGWTVGSANASTIPLAPLGAEESELLVQNLLGSVEPERQIPRRIAEAAGGIPLFVEEMLSMLIDEGLLERGDGGWTATADLTAVPVPPTIQAVLAGRLDRLGPGERRALEGAAVIGKTFFLGAVAALSPESARTTVLRDVEALVRKDLVRPEPSTLPGEDACAFRHALIRDVAYEGLPKALRAELHERYADWLEGVAGDRVAEQEEVVGFHLEQAVRYRAELGPRDERGSDLARRAAEGLTSAGRRALARADVGSAVDLLSRATALLPEGDLERLAAAPDLGRALSEAGELERAEELLTAAIAEAGRRGEEGIEAHAGLVLLDVRARMDPAAWHETRSVTDAIIPVFERLGDDLGLARAWYDRGLTTEDDVESAECLERGEEHARRAGDRRLAVECRYWLLVRVLFDTATPLTECERLIAGFREEVERIGVGRESEAWVLDLEGHDHSLRGRHERARATFRRMDEIFEELGRTYWVVRWVSCAALAELEADEPAEAERILIRGYETLERMGGRGELPALSLCLAEAAYRQGLFEDAETHALAAVGGDATDSFLTALGNLLRAKALAAVGGTEEAERLARDAAVVLAPHWEANVVGGLHPVGRLDLAEVLRLCGQTEEAGAVALEALAAYERKEADGLAARARAFIERLGEGRQGPGATPRRCGPR